MFPMLMSSQPTIYSIRHRGIIHAFRNGNRIEPQQGKRELSGKSDFKAHPPSSRARIRTGVDGSRAHVSRRVYNQGGMHINPNLLNLVDQHTC